MKIIHSLKTFFGILLATLREIFDENAYQRFLVRTNNTSSAESYRLFMKEREASTAQRPRCC